MQDESQNTSITILLVICIAVLASIGIGWFVLDSGDDPEPVADPGLPSEAAPLPTPVVEEESVEAVVEESPDAAVDTDLRKARMAAEADILTSPFEQSALYFYGNVLKADPRHEVANAEVDAVLGRLAGTAADYLAAPDYAAAFNLAQQVAAVRPDHSLVNNVQQTLDQYSGELVTQAMAFAEAGDEASARETLAQAAALPGRNRSYFRAVGESIDDLLQAREAAEQQRVESEQLAAVRETGEWMEKVRSAIAAGRLVAPAEDCAFSYLSERDAEDEITLQLRQELFSAVLAEANANIGIGELELAETLLASATDIDEESEELGQVMDSLENAYFDREADTILPVTSLNRLTMVPAEYPRRAEERGVTGWVEIEFTVLPDGNTSGISVAGSEPKRIFDASAIKAVEQWTFEPREFRGQLIAQRSVARLVFKLQ